MDSRDLARELRRAFPVEETPVVAVLVPEEQLVRLVVEVRHLREQQRRTLGDSFALDEALEPFDTIVPR